MAPPLRRVEGVEELVHAQRVDAQPGVPHGHTHTVVVLSLGPDRQLPRAIGHLAHRFDRVEQQVQDDLLELDTIASDERKVVGKLCLENDAVPLKIA